MMSLRTYTQMMNLNIMTNMGEPEAKEVILKGFVTIDGIEYIIHPQNSGSCDNCAFEDREYCPQLALNICCTGGNILKYSNF